MTKHSGRRLAAMFTALLAGCSGRDLPGDDAGATDGETTGGTTSGTTEDPTTTASPTTDSPTSASTTASPSTSDPTASTTTPPDPSGDPSSDPTFETSESECVYAHHDIVLTPGEYEQWLDGEATAGDTDTAGTTAADDSGTAAEGSTVAADESAGETAGDTASETTSADDGWSLELCKQICVALAGAEEWSIDSCEKIEPDADGNIQIKCVEILEHCDGRSHACITSRGAVTAADPVAAHLARAAHDEAASVHAFIALAAELAAAGAPAELLARIRAAAADEVRHAKAVAVLASSRGAACTPPAETAVPARSLREIAVENAVEGCVRETWAALLAAHQATYATDPEIRRVMQVIAADEARHAELAWAIDAWLRGALDPADWADVEAARAAAAQAVIAGVHATTPALRLVVDAGLPDRPRAARLVEGLAAALWQTAA